MRPSILLFKINSLNQALKLLKIDPNVLVTKSVIKSAYFEQCKSYHPDGGGTSREFGKLRDAKDFAIANLYSEKDGSLRKISLRTSRSRRESGYDIKSKYVDTTGRWCPPGSGKKHNSETKTYSKKSNFGEGHGYQKVKTGTRGVDWIDYQHPVDVMVKKVKNMPIFYSNTEILRIFKKPK